LENAFSIASKELLYSVGQVRHCYELQQFLGSQVAHWDVTLV